MITFAASILMDIELSWQRRHLDPWDLPLAGQRDDDPHDGRVNKAANRGNDNQCNDDTSIS